MESHLRRFRSREEALAACARWKQFLPVVPSAYQPSGIVPAEAWPLLLLGAALGAGAGALAGTLVFAVAGGLTAVPVGLLVAIVEGRVIPIYFTLIVGCIAVAAVIATYVGTFAALGTAVAKVVAYFGQMGKSRSTTIALVLSLLSSATALLMCFLAVQLIIARVASGPTHEFLDVLFGRGFIGMGAYQWSPLTWINLMTGFALAVYFTRKTTSNAPRFCERCEQFMDEHEMLRISFEEAVNWAQGLRDESMAQYGGGMLADGTGLGLPKVFECPICGAGYLDLYLNFKAGFYDENGASSIAEESWMIGSCALTREGVENIKSWLLKEKPST